MQCSSCFLENTAEVFLWEVACISSAVWAFGVSRSRGSMGCLSVLHLEKCNSEEVCVHRKISRRVLLVWLIIVAQRRQRNEVFDYINRLFPFSRYDATCFEFANLVLSDCDTTRAQGFFAKDVRDPGSVVSLRGLPSTLNFHLHGSALMPGLYSGRRVLFRAPGEALCEDLKAQWPARDKRRIAAQSNGRGVLHLYPHSRSIFVLCNSAWTVLGTRVPSARCSLNRGHRLLTTECTKLCCTKSGQLTGLQRKLKRKKCWETEVSIVHQWFTSLLLSWLCGAFECQDWLTIYALGRTTKSD